MNALPPSGRPPAKPFAYAPMFPLGEDRTPWRKLDIEGVSVATCDGRTVLKIAPRALSDLAAVPGNHFESLIGDRLGQYSIRIDDRGRICFEWKDGDAYWVEIVDYH